MNKKNKQRVDPVEVYCRIRPLSDDENESCLKILDENNLMLEIPECSASFRSGQIKKIVYSFAQIFDETTTQKQIFDQVGLSLVQDLLAGKNGLLFTYGVTGSGKTYSMIGNQQELGILQRSLDTVFNSISFQQAKKHVFRPDKMNSFDLFNDSDCFIDKQTRKEYSSGSQVSSNQYQVQNQRNENVLSNLKNKPQPECKISNEPNGKLVNVNEDHIYAVFISCVEIYNNYIYDLLDEFNNSSDSTRRMDNNKESKSLKEDVKGSMFIKEVAEIEVTSSKEALDLMLRAQNRRVVAYTELNSESSRSHSIFTIRVVQAAFDPTLDHCSLKKSSIHVSQLSLVDLAGSERTKRTKNTGSRLKEAGSINSSLMALRNCMETLRENIINGTRKMVPYRDSKLTLLFKNYFEGNGKIKMILCINPSAIEFDETINVLKFSDLVRDILVPLASNDLQKNLGKVSVDKISIDSLEQTCLSLLVKLQQNNYSLMPDSFPPLDIFSPDDDVTINKLIDYLEEYQRRRNSFIQETEALRQQYYLRLKDLTDEAEKFKEEQNDLKTRLELKEKEQVKLDTKMKALEKVINTNNFRTPMPTISNKENRPQFATPSRAGVSTSSASGSGATGGIIIGGSGGSSVGGPTMQAANDKPSSASSITKTPMTSTIRSETPLPSTYRSSRITHTTATQCRTYAINSQPPPLPPQTPLKEGIPVANRRNQRRSKSAEMWLDHKPPNMAKIDTVMQPKMPRKKSVSKLELNDAKKSSKYLLTHQQQDEEGEIVTNLIKGDILQSPSGGANVIFTDVETLQLKTQDSLKSSLKRASEDNRELLEDRFVVEERCSIAIEGHKIKPLK